MEVGEDSEGMIPTVQLQFTGADFQINNGADADGRKISVVLYIHGVSSLKKHFIYHIIRKMNCKYLHFNLFVILS